MRRLTALITVLLITSSCAQYQTGELKVPDLPGLRFVQVGDWRIRVDEIGAGEPVLLIHGYSSTLEEWRPALPSLCEGRRCILVDLPGFGLSDKREGDYSPETMARHLFGVLDALGIPSADVVGHSWGCSVALAMALEAPARVRSLVLTGAWVYYDQLPTFMLWSRLPGVGEVLYTAFFDQQPDMRYEEIFRDPAAHVREEDVDLMQHFLKSPGAIRAALQAARDQRFERLEPRYPEVRHPTLLVWCEEDRVALPHYARRLAADLPAAKLEWLTGCGHVPQVEVPEQWSRRVREFLDTVGGASAPNLSTLKGLPQETGGAE